MSNTPLGPQEEKLPTAVLTEILTVLTKMYTKASLVSFHVFPLSLLCLDILASLLSRFALLFGGVSALFSESLGGYPARKARKIAKGEKHGNPKRQGKGDQGSAVSGVIKSAHRKGGQWKVAMQKTSKHTTKRVKPILTHSSTI